jgi:hypothetical protein
MFFKANHALEAVADYTKLPDGTWTVEVPALKLRVIGRTPIECKHRLLDEFDLRLAEWIVGVTEGSEPAQSLIPTP